MPEAILTCETSVAVIDPLAFTSVRKFPALPALLSLRV